MDQVQMHQPQTGAKNNTVERGASAKASYAKARHMFYNLAWIFWADDMITSCQAMNDCRSPAGEEE